jgi:hypothetical protein
VDVTSQQRMLTPPRHLILPSHLLEVCVNYPTLDFVIAFWTMVTFYTLLTSPFCISIGRLINVTAVTSSQNYLPLCFGLICGSFLP